LLAWLRGTYCPPVIKHKAMKNGLYGVKLGSQPAQYRVIPFSAILCTIPTGSLFLGHPINKVLIHVEKLKFYSKSLTS